MSDARNIYTAAQAAGQSSSFKVGRHPVQVTIYRSGGGSMTAAEYSDLQKQDLAGDWHDVYDSADTGAVANQVRLHAGRTTLVVVGTGTYRIDKGVTTEVVGIEVETVVRGV